MTASDLKGWYKTKADGAAKTLPSFFSGAVLLLLRALMLEARYNIECKVKKRY